MCLRPPQHGNVQSLATALKVQSAHSVHISYESSISGRLEPGSSQDRLAYTLHDVEGQMMMALIPSGRGPGGSWESRTSRGRSRMVSGGSGVFKLETESDSFNCVGYLCV